MDVKKFAHVPGRWRQEDPRTWHGALQPVARQPRVHAVVADCSRMAYSETQDNETTTTALDFWPRVVARFAEHDITIEQLMTDNGRPTDPWR